MAYLLPQGNIYQNFLLNSNFAINQRASASYATASRYTVDRFWATSNYTTFAVSPQVTGPTNAPNVLRLAVTTIGAGTLLDVIQPVPTATTLQLTGLQAVYSILVRKSAGFAAGSFNLTAQYTTTVDDTASNVDNGTTIGSTVTLTASQLTTTFQLMQVAFTVPAAARTLGVQMRLNSTPTVGGEYIEIQQATLNVGSAPAPWMLATGNGVSELIACYSFYQKAYAYATIPGTATFVGYNVTNSSAVLVLNGNSYVLGNHPRFQLPMRAVPSVTLWDNAGTVNSWNIGSSTPSASLPLNISSLGFEVSNNTGGSVTPLAAASYGHWAAEAEL